MGRVMFEQFFKILIFFVLSRKTGWKVLIFDQIRANKLSVQAYNCLFILNLSREKLVKLFWLVLAPF